MERNVAGRIEVIGHRNFKEAHEELFGLVSFASGISIYAIVGPTGAGKSRFVEELEAALTGPVKRENVVELFRHFLYTECVTQSDGFFLWSDYYTRSLMELNEPCIDQKRRPTSEEMAFLHGDTWPRSITKRDAALRLAFENTLRRRRVKWLAMDDAHVLTYVRREKAYLGQAETLKSLANTSHVILILSGTYQLLDLLGLNSQLRRRTHVIHLAPYDGTDEEDMKEFSKTLRTLINKLKVQLEMNFGNFAAFIFTNSQGCIGAAHDLVIRASTFAHIAAKKGGENVITASMLEKCQLSDEDRNTLVDDIRIGRDKMMRFKQENEKEKSSRLKSTEPQKEGVIKDVPKKKKGRRVGRRSPIRDPVLPHKNQRNKPKIGEA